MRTRKGAAHSTVNPRPDDEMEHVYEGWADKDPLFLEARLARDYRSKFLSGLKQVRKRLGLNQHAVAGLMQSTQSAVARLESGRGDPRMSTMERYAAAVGARLKLDFDFEHHDRAMNALEDSLRRAHATRSGLDEVIERLRVSWIYVLGEPAGDLSVPGLATESNMLHFQVAVNDREVWFLPGFTQPAIMLDALKRNPEWRTLSVLEVSGDALLKNRADDVVLVVNPWSPMEIQVPSRAEFGSPTTELRAPTHESQSDAQETTFKEIETPTRVLTETRPQEAGRVLEEALATA
jgi:transcriptional regulator with XRE-family HTH domain